MRTTSAMARATHRAEKTRNFTSTRVMWEDHLMARTSSWQERVHVGADAGVGGHVLRLAEVAEEPFGKAACGAAEAVRGTAEAAEAACARRAAVAARRPGGALPALRSRRARGELRMVEARELGGAIER